MPPPPPKNSIVAAAKGTGGGGSGPGLASSLQRLHLSMFGFTDAARDALLSCLLGDPGSEHAVAEPFPPAEPEEEDAQATVAFPALRSLGLSGMRCG